MGIQDNILGYLRTKNREIKGTDDHSSIFKTFSFTSIGGGSGSTMSLLYLSQFLAEEKDKQVCVLDLNFTEPDMLYHYNVDVTTENTIINYLKGRRNLVDCYIQDKKVKNIHLVTAAPTDDPLLTLSLGDDETIITELIEQLNVFDYVLINLPYTQNGINFVGAITAIDKGYVVIDERLSSIMKLKQFLDYLHVFHGRSNVFNNVILNKRTRYDYPYNQLMETKSDIIAEIPFEERVVHYMNYKDIFYKKDLSKDFQLGINEIISDFNEG